jgi:hypothetical protein
VLLKPSRVLAMLLVQLHAATALLATRGVAPQHHASRFNTGQRGWSDGAANSQGSKGRT